MAGVGVELLGVIAVGIGMAAVLYAGTHLARKMGFAPAIWLLPAGIGAAMIAYSIWTDYTWKARATARLPQDARILLIGYDSQAWAPWTYLRPVEVRLAAIDPGQIERRPDGTRSAAIMLVERRGPMLVVTQDFNCAQGQARRPQGDWQAVPADDPAFAVVCADKVP